MAEIKKFSVKSEYAGARLDQYLQGENEGVSRSFIRNLIDKNCVLVGGEVKKSGYAVRFGDEIEVYIDDPTPLDMTPSEEKLEIVYQDDYLAVINKRQGMTVHAGAGTAGDTLVNALLSNLDKLSSINGVIRPGIVHRLDKNTSGLLVVAKCDSAHISLQKQIEQKTAKRCYVALVNGSFAHDSGIINQPIGRSKKDRKKMAVVFDGRDAITHYKVLQRFDKHTLVEFELKTGRTHQIRVHSKHLGHIIVGDLEYGDKNMFGLKGQLLHAFHLEFDHPKSGERMVFEAKIPAHFDEILKLLEKSLYN